MPPSLALFLTLVFCGYLLWRDVRRTPKVSFALWLPVVWVFLIGSRFLSQWLNILGIPVGGGASLEDGSPLDAVVFLALITAGMVVLLRRRFSPTVFVAGNIWLTIFVLYALLSISWSDFPFVAGKRFVKILGQPIMALIILTDPDREEALRRVLKRSAYLLMPLSILFIKYYPEFGRYFDTWSGGASGRGVALSKNMLGSSCLVFGLFFLWNLLTVNRLQHQERRQEIGISLLFMWMTWWLLSSADSATSVACLAVGAVTILMLGMRGVSRYFGSYVIVGIILAGFAQVAFDVYGKTLGLLGREATLTTRTEMWQDLLSIPINPLLGTGYESFWLGDRLAFIWSLWDFGPNQAHNGYLETYLNLGWIGVALLAGLLLATFRKSQAELLRNADFGRLRLAFLLAILGYNYTEAAFKGLHFMWFMLLLISIDYMGDRSRGRAALVSAEGGTNERHMNDRLPAHKGWRKLPSPEVVGGRVPNRPWRKPARPAATQPATVRRWR